MATKEEITNGLQFLVQEARRIGDGLSEEDWAKARDFDGWKNKEVLAHVAAVGSIVPQFAKGLESQAPGTDAGEGLNIDQLNAALVGARAGKSVQELVDEIVANYATVIDYVRGLGDDVLTRRATFGGYKDTELGDIMIRMVVLHGLAHIYSAYSAVMGM